MRCILPLTLCFLLLPVTGCGSDEPAEAERDVAAERDADLERAAEDMANSMVGALGEAMGGEGRAAESVDFRVLRDLLPESLNGMERVDTSGERTGVSGFSFSQTRGEYRSDDGDRQVELQLVDAGGVAPLSMLASWRLVEFDRETADGYERTTEYEGYPAMEKVRTGAQPRSELSFVVADRFLVTANGRNIEMDELKEAVEEIDLGELEDLRDEGREE